MPFNGFPANVRATPVPDPLFNSLLAEIEDAAELKVTLRALWLLRQKPGPLRALTESELLNDPTLLQGVKALGGNSQDPREQVQAALARAVSRQTLLRHSPEPGSRAASPRYLLNTEYNRRQLARRPAQTGPPLSPEPDSTEPPAAANRPNIYALYEDNIGLIGPQMAAYLQEAEDSYPALWIAQAFDLAIRENKRSWAYISAILRRWAAEGKINSTKPAGNPPPAAPGIGVKAGASLWPKERIENGKPGRHPPPDRRPRYPEDYQRR